MIKGHGIMIERNQGQLSVMTTKIHSHIIAARAIPSIISSSPVTLTILKSLLLPDQIDSPRYYYNLESLISSGPKFDITNPSGIQAGRSKPIMKLG
jgi:hypothetical protein